MKKQMIIIMDSVDMCGKTEVAKELSKQLNIPVYKNKEEHTRGHDKMISLFYGVEELTQFLEQTGYSIIFDRFHASEFVYSKVLKRWSNDEKVFDIDYRLSKMNCFIIYPWKSKEKYQEDDQHIIKIEQYDELKKMYEVFFEKTSCNVIKYNADDENTLKQVEYILKMINDNNGNWNN